MVASDVLRAVAFGLLIVPMPTPLLLLLAFVAGLATPPFEAARTAIVPEAVGEDRLGDAIALTNVTFQVSQAVGFALGGILVAAVDPQTALLLNAATFAVSALLLLGLKAGRHRASPEAPLARVRTALALVRRRSLLRRVVVLFLLIATADAVVSALLPVFVLADGYTPLLLTALAVTAPLVGAVSGALVPREGASGRLLRTAAWLIFIGGAVCAILMPLAGMHPGTLGAIVAVAGIVAYGLTVAADVPSMTAAMRSTPDELRATFVAVIQPGLMGVQALGALAAGFLALRIDTTTVMAVALVLPVGYALSVLLRRTPPQPALRTIDLRFRSTVAIKTIVIELPPMAMPTNEPAGAGLGPAREI
jgi:MFS family permease